MPPQQDSILYNLTAGAALLSTWNILPTNCAKISKYTGLGLNIISLESQGYVCYFNKDKYSYSEHLLVCDSTYTHTFLWLLDEYPIPAMDYNRTEDMSSSLLHIQMLTQCLTHRCSLIFVE